MLWELFEQAMKRYADGTLRWNDCLNWIEGWYSLREQSDILISSYAGGVGL